MRPTPPPSLTRTRTAPIATRTLSWPSRTAATPTGQTKYSRRRQRAPALRACGRRHGQRPTSRRLSSVLRRRRQGWRLRDAP
ncbi:MAG: hypothetical protein DMD52_08845 [Gemmatimonadetes bacterium]|nr:MAG: hypothetical protein DMD52_08845 [Gemmatimonadota bacterium]